MIYVTRLCTYNFLRPWIPIEHQLVVTYKLGWHETFLGSIPIPWAPQALGGNKKRGEPSLFLSPPTAFWIFNERLSKCCARIIFQLACSWLPCWADIFPHPRQLGEKNNVCWPKRLIEFQIWRRNCLLGQSWFTFQILVSDAPAVYQAIQNSKSSSTKRFKLHFEVVIARLAAVASLGRIWKVNSDWLRRQLRCHIGTQ